MTPSLVNPNEKYLYVHLRSGIHGFFTEKEIEPLRIGDIVRINGLHKPEEVELFVRYWQWPALKSTKAN